MPQIRTDLTRPARARAGRRRAILLVLTIGLALCAPPALSAEYTAGRKFGRGAANLTLGVLAIPGQIVRTSRKSGPFVGGTWGLVKGVSFMVASEVVGLFELATCPFETPPGYVPILKPEFPWQYFNEAE